MVQMRSKRGNCDGREEDIMSSRGRSRVLLTAGLAVILVLAMSASAFAATGTTKKLSAIFKNIQVLVGGQALQMETEPFIVNGRTYVPLRVIGEALGVGVDWNGDTNVITVGSAASEDELYQKDIQIAQLQLQVQELQAQLDSASSSSTDDDDTDDDDIDDLEADLIDDYDSLEDVDIEDISLSGDEDDVTVAVEVDLGDYDDEWADLTNSEIKSWVSDICDDIQDFYSTSTDISGKIKDTDSGDTLVTFSKDGSSSLSISYKDDDYRGDSDDDIDDLEDDLIDDYDWLEEVEIEDLSLSGDEDDVEVEIEVDLSDYDDEWADLSDSDIEYWLEDLCDDIQDYYSDDTVIVGEIIDGYSDDTLVEFEMDGDDDLDVDYLDEDDR